MENVKFHIYQIVHRYILLCWILFSVQCCKYHKNQFEISKMKNSSWLNPNVFDGLAKYLSMCYVDLFI
jgi:hypothetical protein